MYSDTHIKISIIFVVSIMSETLFEPITMGDLELKNKIIMAPLTRCRATKDRVPTDIMVKYYGQRASAGMIITEGTIVDEFAGGYPDTPGIYNQKQVEGWKKITDEVHKKGGKIVVQLWHVGRISDPVYTGGKPPVAPSAIKPSGTVSLVRPKREYVLPHALTVEEIKKIVSDFKNAANMAKEAGFDGVELHGANGYLLDQFLNEASNTRKDEYGGSIENRMRFPLEVVDAVCGVWGAGRVGYHISPRCDEHSMGGSENSLKTFTPFLKELSKRSIAFVFSRSLYLDDNLNFELKKQFSGKFIINQKLTKELAEEKILKQEADAAAFGVLFIQNPDLVERFKNNKPVRFVDTDKSNYYIGGEVGYTDYKPYEEE